MRTHLPRISLASTACLCVVLAAGCGGSGHSAADAPLVAVPNPSPVFGSQLSRTCEGVYWQLQRYYHDRTRAGIDDTSIIHGGVVRLKRLHPPKREVPALGQLIDAFGQIETLFADGAIGPTLTFEGFLESEKAITRALKKPGERIVTLARRMLAPGCVDVILGRSWRKRQTGATA